MSLKQPAPNILLEADGLIHGDRNSAYGHPLDNHSTTAAMLTAFLRRKYGGAITLDADDVCMFNILQKAARLANTPGHRDSLVDIAGYAGNIEMVQAERKARAS
jgi:hypothetical protein